MNDLTVESVGKMAHKDMDGLIQTMMVLEQADCPVFHYFNDGVYIREARFPAGAFVVGHTHRYEQLNIFVQGKGKFIDPAGGFKIMSAPMTFVGPPGRKAVYVLEDIIWQNAFPNPDNEHDIEKLEARWLEETLYFEAFKETKMLLSLDDDYEKMLVDIGMTAEEVSEYSNIDFDLVPFPKNWESHVAVRKSPIHGKGLFAEANISQGSLICPARINGRRTPAGRYTNHSGAPNAVATRIFGDDLGWVALRDIHGRRGGFNGEEITVDYRQVREVAV